MTIIISEAVGISAGFFCWAIVYYLHFNDKCPPRHSAIIAGIGTAQLALSSSIVFSAKIAAGWDIVAYAILTTIALGVAFRGWYTIMTEEKMELLGENKEYQ